MATNNCINNSYTKITQIDASGTWTKSVSPPSKWIEVIGYNSGLGGGSGRKGTSGSSGGGAGGQTGGGFYWFGPASAFSPTETVTIGGTSNGGSAQTADGQNGNDGNLNNVSSFGSITGRVALNAPPGGTTTTTTQRPGASSPSPWGANGTGFQTGQGSNTDGTVVPIQDNFMSGGGAGGGSGADTVTPRQGANARGYSVDGTTIILAGGLGGISSGTVAGGDGNPSVSTHGVWTGGTGGGGGGGSSGGAAGKGGDGAIPGGSGGGGGGGISAVANSGAGGNGARGRIIVIEYF